MRILETRFANTRKNKGEDSGPKVVVTVDDNSDDGSDESGAAETEISTHKQESTHSTSGMDEDLDEDQYYSHDEDTYPDFDTNLEEPNASDTPPALASDRGQRVDIELVSNDPLACSTWHIDVAYCLLCPIIHTLFFSCKSYPPLRTR
ncbi:unnamed protein product [Prunus brigantina]